MTDDDWESPPPPATVSRNGTFDPESYVLACCLMDQGESLSSVSQLAATDFRDWRNGLIFSTLRRMRESQQPIDLSTLAEELGPRLSDVGGLPALMALDDPIRFATTAHLAKYTQRILQDSANLREVNKAKQLLERANKGEDVGEVASKKIAFPKRKPFDFEIGSDGDESILLGNRYLNRGDGMVLVGSSGMGKSSASIQMAISWALGRDFHGIKSNGPLRIIIVQSEDSDGDIAEVMLSMRHMMKLTDSDISTVNDRVRIVCDRVNRGQAFVDSLKKHIAEFPPDLVIINPLQAFMDGDVTQSKDLGEFLRGSLNGINDNKFGYILIHHTTKPATGRDRSERQWHEVMYDMAGGAEIINWARAIISLRAAKTNTPGDFDLVLAKRGRRAGVTATTGEAPFTKQEVVTSIPVRHASGSIAVPGRVKPVSVIFWEPRTRSSEETPQKGVGGRPEKYPFSNWSSVFPEKNTPGLPVHQLMAKLRLNGAIGEKSIHGVLSRWMDRDQAIEFTLDKNGVKLWRKSL